MNSKERRDKARAIKRQIRRSIKSHFRGQGTGLSKWAARSQYEAEMYSPGYNKDTCEKPTYFMNNHRNCGGCPLFKGCNSRLKEGRMMTVADIVRECERTRFRNGNGEGGENMSETKEAGKKAKPEKGAKKGGPVAHKGNPLTDEQTAALKASKGKARGELVAKYRKEGITVKTMRLALGYKSRALLYNSCKEEA